MSRFKVSVEGHEIEIWASLWSGEERISYDGEVVSEKRSFFRTTTHSFEVEEEGKKVVYEVTVSTGGILNPIGYAVRRNGIIQAHEP